MPGITEKIPLPCHDCDLFYDDLQRAESLEAELDTLDQEAGQGHERKNIERRIARVLLGLGFFKDKLEYNKIYTVGCPGFDMMDAAEAGQIVDIGRCLSPLREP